MIVPRLSRLRGRGIFSQIYQRGVAWSNPYLVIKVLPQGECPSRWGFAVGKALGGAVERNRVRRRLREVARQSGVGGGWNIILVARPPARGADFSQLKGAVTDLLRRSRLIQEE